VSSAEILSLMGIGAILVMVAGFYSVIMSNNLIRTLIGVEILTKSVTLLIIIAGSVSNQMPLAQAIAITIIIIEVVLTVVAVGIILCLFRHEKTMDSKIAHNLKG
jgi:NADH:ubiquinone oxidoreductase subunit K